LLSKPHDRQAAGMVASLTAESSAAEAAAPAPGAAAGGSGATSRVRERRKRSTPSSGDIVLDAGRLTCCAALGAAEPHAVPLSPGAS